MSNTQIATIITNIDDIESYLDNFMKQTTYLESICRKNWEMNIGECECGVKIRYTPEEFLKRVPDDEIRINGIINSGILSQWSIGLCKKNENGYKEFIPNPDNFNFLDLLTGTPVNTTYYNYFIINDPAYGGACDVCGSNSYIVLLAEPEKDIDYDRTIWLPSLETYITCSQRWNIKIENLLGKYPPVPVNPWKDFWYCTKCKVLKKFGYDDETGLVFSNILFDKPEFANKRIF